MTLQINILQSIVARQRTTLTGLHEHVVFWKNQSAYDGRDTGYANYCHKQAAKYSKDIAKLALVQKKLKREISEQISTGRKLRGLVKKKLTRLIEESQAQGAL